MKLKPVRRLKTRSCNSNHLINTVYKGLLTHCLIAFCLFFPSLVLSACFESGVQLQILGSGGPGNASGRASSGYLIWNEGTAQFMIDAGSGTKDQFHQAGGDLAAIELLALSHLHPDHASGLPGILWPAGGNLRISGPSGSGVFPAIDEFLNRLFASGGAFAVLGDRTEFEISTIDVNSETPVQVYTNSQVSVSARGVPHGDVPTLAYQFKIGDISIAFTSDQNGTDPGFIDFIRDVDFLVIHLATDEQPIPRIAELHAKPSVWGQMATAAGVGHVVVSHISTASPQVLNNSLSVLRENYTGELTVGEDMLCVDLGS